MPPPPPSVDLDLRLVRYFVAVAEHLNFGRAAAALYVPQPSLSRQIGGLEQRLGFRLFDRTTQGTRLSAAGEVFLPLAMDLLHSADEAATRARAVARPGQITVGYTTGIVVTRAVQDLRRRHPDADVRTLHLAWNEPRPALLDRRVDVAVARLPFATDRLHVVVLYDEPRLLLVPRDHRLAGRVSVTLDDIAGEPMPREPDPTWSAFWRVDPRPDGSPAPDGPLVDALDDKLELIASGQAVAIVSAGLRGDSLRPDLTSVPLEGVEPSHVVLVTRRGDRSSLVAAFRTAAQRHLVGHNATVIDPGPVGGAALKRLSAEG